MRNRTRWRSWTLLLFSLGVIELGLRLPLGNAALQDLYQYGLDDGRCLGLVPGGEVEYTGWLLRIPPVLHAVNAQGYRGSPRPETWWHETQTAA